MLKLHRIIEVTYLIGLVSALFPTRTIYPSAAIGLLGIVLIVIDLLIQKQVRFKVINEYILFVFFWLICGLVSFYWVKDLGLWQTDVFILALNLGYAIFTSYVLENNPKFINDIFRIIYLSGFIHVFISVYEIQTGNYIFTSNIDIIPAYQRQQWPLSFFHNVNDLAMLLLLVFIIALYTNNKIFNGKLGSLFNNILRFFLLLVTFSIAVISDARLVVVCMGVALAFRIYLHFYVKNMQLFRIFFILLSVLAAIYGLIRLSDLNLMGTISNDSDSIYIRYSLLNEGINLMIDSNILGVGAGNAVYYTNGESLHSWWVENLANYGLIFFFIYIVYYLFKIFQSFDLMRKLKTHEIMICLNWITIFVLSSFVSSSNFNKVWIWIVNGITFIYISVINTNIKKNKI